MSELGDRQKAAAKVFTEVTEAHERGEVSLEFYVGFRLFLVAYMMKKAHAPGAVQIAQEYCTILEMDGVLMEQQVEARIAETMEFNRMTKEAQ